MNAVIAICFVVLVVAAGLCVLRLLRAESFADRIVATDVLLGIIVTGIGVELASSRQGILLNLLVVTALLGFVATVTVARFMEQRGT